ncbi:hypothetical protein LguiA_026329 [Lonicera macranthoides]
MTKPGCPYRCEGNNKITIPYPFGIGADCARNESFIITCDNSSGITTVPVIIQVALALLEVIVDDSRVLVSDLEPTPLDANFTGTPFRYQNLSTVTAMLSWGMLGNCSGTFSCGINALCGKGAVELEFRQVVSPKCKKLLKKEGAKVGDCESLSSIDGALRSLDPECEGFYGDANNHSGSKRELRTKARQRWLMN